MTSICWSLKEKLILDEGDSYWKEQNHMEDQRFQNRKYKIRTEVSIVAETDCMAFRDYYVPKIID